MLHSPRYAECKPSRSHWEAQVQTVKTTDGGYVGCSSVLGAQSNDMHIAAVVFGGWYKRELCNPDSGVGVCDHQSVMTETVCMHPIQEHWCGGVPCMAKLSALPATYNHNALVLCVCGEHPPVWQNPDAVQFGAGLVVNCNRSINAQTAVSPIAAAGPPLGQACFELAPAQCFFV